MPPLANHIFCLLNWISLHVYFQWKGFLHTLPSSGQDVLGPTTVTVSCQQSLTTVESKMNANETHGNMRRLILSSATLRKQGFPSDKVLPLTSLPLPFCCRHSATVQVAESGKCVSTFNYLTQKSDTFYQRLYSVRVFHVLSSYILKRAYIKGCSPLFPKLLCFTDSKASVCSLTAAGKLKQCSSINSLCLVVLAAMVLGRVHRQYAPVCSPLALSTPTHCFQNCHLF